LGRKPHRSSVFFSPPRPRRPARLGGTVGVGVGGDRGAGVVGPGGGATLPCGSLSPAVVSRAEDERARASAVLARGRGAGRTCSRGVARTGAGEPGARPGGVPRDAFLTPAEPRTPARRSQVARLETRTKESDVRASGRAVRAPHAERKRGGRGSRATAPRRDGFSFRGKLAPSADPDFLERFERERARRDPKDRELWATRTRPEETLVEVRSGTDVQIVRRSCL